MPGPFYNAIKGTTAGAPGTGAFTPNAAGEGGRAWSTVPIGVYYVRFEDGASFQLSYCYWNGATLSRGANQVDPPGEAVLALGASATATLVGDANEISPDWSGLPPRGYLAIPNTTTTPTALGVPAVTVTGTAAAAAIISGNYLTQQPRSQINSALTANAQCGWSNSTSWAATSNTAGRGGFLFGTRFGPSALPASPRLFVGLTSATFVAQTIEPSAFSSARFAIFGKDSTDANIQFMVANQAAATKQNTGIPLAIGSFYEVTIWSEPGSLDVFGLLVQLDTGLVWFGKATANTPANGQTLIPNVIGGLSAASTVFQMNIGHMFFRMAA